MHHIGPRSASWYFLPAWLLIQLAGNVEAAPVVTSISPNAARAGDVLEVTGTGLTGTREVLFASGNAIKPAQFKVVADEQLEVTFPEYYRGTGSAAIIVVGRDEVTVAMPEEMQTVDADSGPGVSAPFLHVVKDGIVRSAPGIEVIGDGGLVVNDNNPNVSAVCFVKRNGTLVDFRGSVVFHEPGAVFGDELKSMTMPPRLVQVQEITISPHIDPVLIKNAEAPQPFAKEPPVLITITPSEGRPGDIVELRGEHLSHVSDIYFPKIIGLQEAGFKVMSDHLVRVEIPQRAFGRQLIVVRNAAGIRVNIGENPPPPVQRLDRQAEERERKFGTSFHVLYVRANQIKEELSGGGSIVVIDKGGTFTSGGGGGNCCFLVRNGGRLALREAVACVIFHETDAILPSAVRTQKPQADTAIMDVGQIVFSRHPFNFDILDPPN